jgi:Na+-driven multidrug efflux pump
LLLFPGFFLSQVQEIPAFIEQGKPVLRVVAVAMVMMSFSTISLNAVTGTGNTRTNLLIEAITILAYSIYVYLVLEYFFLSLTIGWMSEWLYWALTFSMSYAYLRSGRWKGKVI